MEVYMEFIRIAFPSILVAIIAGFVLVYQQISFLRGDIIKLQDKVFKYNQENIELTYKIKRLEYKVEEKK